MLKSLDDIIKARIEFLKQEAETFSNLTAHAGEKGRLNETHFMKTLREFLPQKMGLGTGFVQSSGKDESGNPVMSGQQDIIIYDALNNVPLYSSDSWSVFPIEMVYGLVEVKTTLDINNLEELFRREGTYFSEKVQNSYQINKERINLKSIRGMANAYYRWYLRNVPNHTVRFVSTSSPVPPRFFIFAYKLNTTIDNLIKKLKEFSLKYNFHYHGLCVLEEDFFICRKPLFSNEKYEVISVSENGFKLFLNQLHLSCESMNIGLVDRSKYISGLSDFLPIADVPIEHQQGPQL